PEKIEVVYEPEDGQLGDPKKGIKPSAQQVGKTILTRGAPRVLEEAGRARQEVAVRGFVATDDSTFLPSDFAGAPNKIAVPRMNIPRFDFWMGYSNGHSKAADGENALENLRAARSATIYFQNGHSIKEAKEAVTFDALPDAAFPAPPVAS